MVDESDPLPRHHRRRAEARRLLACADADAAARAALDALPLDRRTGAALIERLRFGPPETWAGWHPEFGRVAVKLWPSADAPPPLLAVTHAGLAPLLAQGPGWRMFAWATGPTLAQALRHGPVAVACLGQIAAALAALHAAGQAHGDVTPANVVLAATGAVLIDWGEDSAGTPGWRPHAAHHARQRDLYGLRKLEALISARSAAGTP